MELGGRLLQIDIAVDRSTASQIKDRRLKEREEKEDKRNLRLKGEGGECSSLPFFKKNQ